MYTLPTVRTYSHALLTRAASRRFGRRRATAAALGATLPDLPALVGAAWLLARRPGRFSRANFEADVCGRTLFARPDAALHSVLPVSGALALYAALRNRDPNRAALFFLLGWAGHVASDALTHGRDARPPLWPLSDRRFESPVSYRERDRHATLLTALEHLAVLAAVPRTRTPADKPTPNHSRP